MHQQPPTVAVATAHTTGDQPRFSPTAPTFTAPAAGPTLSPDPVAATAPAEHPAMPDPAALPFAAPPPLPTAADVPPSPVVATEATASPVAPPVTQAVVRQVDGKYGHAADYTWLQGELDRHYRGHLELRYRPLSEDDQYGGKVRLEDDPRLAEFRPGDVIAVEGELLTDPDGPAAAPWAQYRRYHVRAVQLVGRK
jgi:hypothetical protein